MLSRINRNKSAFTLIELLVVIAIIGLLVGLLVPSLSSAKLEARVAKCKSGMRVIGVAQQQYMNSYDLDNPWCYYYGTQDGTEDEDESLLLPPNMLAKTPVNLAMALYDDPLDRTIPLPAGKYDFPNFLKGPEPLFCPLREQDWEKDFNPYGHIPETTATPAEYANTYIYVYPHVLPADDPFHVTDTSKVNRMCHINTRTSINVATKDVIMYDDTRDSMYEHYNVMKLNGVVETFAQTGEEFGYYLFGPGNDSYKN